MPEQSCDKLPSSSQKLVLDFCGDVSERSLVLFTVDCFIFWVECIYTGLLEVM